MSNNLQILNSTSLSPATCWRGLFSRNCQIHLLSCKSRRNRARKYNKNMQNKANFKIALICISPSITNTYGNLIAFSRPKNKAKQSQFKPNFSSKLGLFFPILALIRNVIYAFAKPAIWEVLLSLMSTIRRTPAFCRYVKNSSAVFLVKPIVKSFMLVRALSYMLFFLPVNRTLSQSGQTSRSGLQIALAGVCEG